MPKLHIKSRASRLRIPALVVDSYEIRCMAIEDLVLPVRDVPVFVDELAESIEQHGLANPVIVVRGPKEDLVRELEGYGSKSTSSMPDRPVLNCVFGGTNRVVAAKKLGYTHIDCIILPTFALGEKLQHLQRESYRSGAETTPVGKQS